MRSSSLTARAAAAFRVAAASTLRLSNSYLGAQFRRFRTKLGAPKAITAMAHKLALLFYHMLRFGQRFVDRVKTATRTLPAATTLPSEQENRPIWLLGCSCSHSHAINLKEVSGDRFYFARLGHSYRAATTMYVRLSRRQRYNNNL